MLTRHCGYTHEVSTRLQVVVDEAELARFRAASDRAGTTLSEWARHALRQAERGAATGDAGQKLDAIHAASAYDFPAPEIDEMLAEIHRGASM